jgi:hypothetical protein
MRDNYSFTRSNNRTVTIQIKDSNNGKLEKEKEHKKLATIN